MPDIIARLEASSGETDWQLCSDIHDLIPEPKCVQPPNYLASLDAAMTLVPEGCDWLRKDFSTMTVVRHGQSLKMWGTHFDATGATPAIALCIAVLRACKGHEAQGEG